MDSSTTASKGVANSIAINNSRKNRRAIFYRMARCFGLPICTTKSMLVRKPEHDKLSATIDPMVKCERVMIEYFTVPQQTVQSSSSDSSRDNSARQAAKELEDILKFYIEIDERYTKSLISLILDTLYYPEKRPGKVFGYWKNGCHFTVETLQEAKTLLERYKMDLRSLNYELTQKPDQLLGGARDKKRNRQGRRKRGKRKPPKGRRTLVQASQLGLRNPRAMTTFPPCVTDLWRYEEVIAADGSGNFSAFISLRDPVRALNGSGVYTRAQNFSSLYDEYKIMELTILLENRVLSTTQGTMGMAVDYDSVPSGTYTIPDLVESEYYREFLGTNQIRYTVKDIPLTSGTSAGGIDCIIHQRGWYDFATPPQEGYVAVAGEGYSPSNKLQVTLTMKVKMRRRRTIAITREKRLSDEKEDDEEQEPIRDTVAMNKLLQQITSLKIK